VTSTLPMMRVSERASFKKCPLAWDWYWNQGWRRRGRVPNALWFGTGVHLALADWYLPGTKRGIDPRETWAKYCSEEIRAVKTEKVNPVTGESLQEWTNAQDLGDHVLGHYLEVYGEDESWDVIAREQTFGVKIPDPKDKGRAITRLHGTFDGVYRDLEDGKVKLMEHKNYASLGTDHLSLDDQGGTYCTVSTFSLRSQGLIGPKEHVTGITYNLLRKAYKDERPKNADGLYTNKPQKVHYIEALWNSDNPDLRVALLGRQIRFLEKLTLAQLAASAEKYGIVVLGEVSATQQSPYFDRPFIKRTWREQRGQIDRIGAEAMAMARFRSGEQPMYKTPRYDCKRFCDFFEVCEVHENGGDTADLFDALFDREDPYADHRKSIAE
jgi:hypothetical protein